MICKKTFGIPVFGISDVGIPGIGMSVSGPAFPSACPSHFADEGKSMMNFSGILCSASRAGVPGSLGKGLADTV